MIDPDSLSEETLREIAAMSGIEIPEAEYEDQLSRLRSRLRAAQKWRRRGLAFAFDDGFDYVPPAHLHRHRWDVPTPMNADRNAPRDSVESGDGDA